MTANRDAFFGTSGPRNADIVLVGECWGFTEAAQQKPFVGASGQELRRMLNEAGVLPGACLFTNVIADHPPNNEAWHYFHPAKEALEPATRHLHPTDFTKHEVARLYRQLEAVKPKLIIAVGNYALWALTNCTEGRTSAESEGRRVPSGIESWRGSMWYADAAPGALAQTKLLPIIHPAAIMREWYKRPVTVHDLRERVPMALRDDWRPRLEPVFHAPPTFDQAHDKLATWLWEAVQGKRFRLVNDIENTMSEPRLLTCIGLADSANYALVIPLVKPIGKELISYWPASEELGLLTLVRQVLMHPNVQVEGQNYLHDMQFLQQQLACRPCMDFDTMLAHHYLFPGTPKALDYLSSLYCKYHWYWKEDSKEWDLKGDLESHLRYNAMDCIRQFEVGTTLRGLIKTMNLEANWPEEMQKNWLALDMMNRGIRIDQNHRTALAADLSVASEELARWFHSIIPQHLSESTSGTPWFTSAIQTRNLFAEEFGFNLPRNRKTGAPTMGKEAIRTLSDRHPEFIRLFSALGDFRSLSVFHKTFVRAPLDPDGRMRCMFNVAGTETFRWSSSENAFGRGTNLQNIPKGNED